MSRSSSKMSRIRQEMAELSKKLSLLRRPSLRGEQNRLLNSFRSNINLLESDAQLIHIIREEPLPADVLLGLLHLRDSDQTSNGILSLELQTYIRCSPERVQIDNLTLCRASDFFRLSVFRPNVYGLFTVRMLDRDQYENYILHLIANDNGERPIRTEKRRLSSRQSSSLNIDDFLKRRLDMNSHIIKSSFISLQSELFIYLTLLDINDNSPIFDQTYFHIKINENQPKDTILTRLHAYDIDKDKNGTVRYEFIIKERQEFSIDMRSGVLRTKHILDREQCEFYRIGIRAYDLGYPNRKYSSMAIVDIQVDNLNDHVPYFIHDLYHFDVQENSPIGTIVGRLTIGDRDEQEPVEKYINLSTIEDVDMELFKSNSSIKTSSTINYSMVDFLFVDSYRNESLSNLFSIDSQGFIRTLVILDRELQSNYTLSILIKHHLYNSLASGQVQRPNINPSIYPILHQTLSTVPANQIYIHQQRDILAKNYRRISINDDIITIDHNDADTSFILPNLYELPEDIRIRVMDNLVDIPTMVSLEETSIYY
ncbi:unnamed protein product [Rotaria sp. Silwood2]|nr:unnamed protein product [Rotaria sp. Silwood2]